MSQYHIYQTDADYAFRRWEYARKEISLKDYKKVYSGELIDSILYNGKTTTCNTDDLKILNELYRKFNTDIPEDFTGHCLSVSDVVEIVRKDEKSYYYCDSLGWQQIQGEKILQMNS